MRFSVVTLSFNQRPFLETAVESVLTQQGVDLEYIIVDPGSTDTSQEFLREYETVVDLRFEPDEGAAEGLNMAFGTATGDVFGYLNADDELLPGSLARVLRAFAAHPTADVVTAHGFITNETGRIAKRVRSSLMSPWRYAYGIADIMQQATFVRREAFFRAGGFNASNKTCWDGELILDLALSGASFALIEDFWANFRIYPTSITGSQRFAEAYAADQARLFAKAMGRKQNRLDRLLRIPARLVKWAEDPTTLLWAIQDTRRAGNQ